MEQTENLKESEVLEPNGTVFCAYCKRPVGKCLGHDLYVKWAYCPCKSEELRKIRTSLHLADCEYL